MALFEEFGKKLSGAGQGMAKQTKDFMEISRLNAVISDQEKMIQQLYARIGEAYFRRHYQDPEAEEKDAIEQIKGLYNEISRNKKAIDTVRGIIRCPRCNAEVPIGTPFCSSCGLKMPVPAMPAQQPAPQMQPVSQNGAQQVPPAGFQAGVMPPAYMQQAPVQAVPQAVGPVCPKCGTRLRPGQLFCSVCGSKIEEQPAAPDYVMDPVEDFIETAPDPREDPVDTAAPDTVEEAAEAAPDPTEVMEESAAPEEVAETSVPAPEEAVQDSVEDLV